MKIKLSHIRYITPILIIALFFLPSITYAAGIPFLDNVLEWFKGALSSILSNAILPLVTNVMSFQNFFTDGVNAGWKATRDFANLFFALILLFIAIATVLNTGGLDNYTAKRMLPQFIFAALFINFSKAIVGFLIDISQIIMISLYNSFGPTLTSSIGSASEIAKAGAETNLDSTIVSLFTIILLVILIFVLLWTAVILAIRIVTLWFVIMLSPLAFVSGLIPPLNSLSNSWKNMLSQALSTGPTLMFLLYLAVTVMNASIGGNSEGGNLLNNGNLLNYVLVIGLLFLANIEAMKAGQSAPPILKNAVGVAGTVATFGLGAYVGAGGYNTNQLRKKTVELADKGAGGATRGVQVLTGGKIKANSRYEAMKKDMTAANDAGKGLFGGVGQQFSKAGQEEQQKKYELEQAKEYAKSNAIDDPTKKRYKKVLLANMSEIASEIKDATSAEELGKQFVKALKDGEIGAAASIAAKISNLEDGWNRAQTNDAEIFQESRKLEDPEAQMGYIMKTAFGKIGQDNSIMTELKSRMTTNLKDKGQGGFADGIRPAGAKSSTEKAIADGVVGVANAYAKNKGILNRRTKITGTGTFKSIDGKPDYETDHQKVYQMIENEGNIERLADYKSWSAFGAKKNTEFAQILTDIKNGVYTDIPTPNIAKIDSALKGLGSSASSRVTGDTI
jgi:hypothetical protein